MKIYIISNVPDDAERYSDALEGTGASIVLKEIDTDTKGLVSAAASAAASGNTVVVLAEDPMLASMLLNKQKGVDAALCNSEKDILKAKQIDANVIVVGADFPKPERLAALFTGIQKDSKPKERQEQTQQREAPKPAGSGVDNSLGRIFAKKPDAQRPQKRPEPKVEENEPVMPQQARKGMLGRIKDSLGIVDEK